MSPKKGIRSFLMQKLKLHSKPLNRPVNYPFLLIYKVNYRDCIFPPEKNFCKEEVIAAYFLTDKKS